MPRNITSLQVFVASPSDVNEERECLEAIVSELNLVWAETLGVQLELVRWETHAKPGFGREPQDVINTCVGDEYDIFIGVMWSRFGTPTTKADSGTHEEFQRAYERFKKNPDEVSIMLYFKNQPIAPADIDPDQIKKINSFKEELGPAGGLYFQFDDTKEFNSLVRIHLGKEIQIWKSRLEDGDSKLISIEPADTAQNVIPAAHETQHEDESAGFIDAILEGVEHFGRLESIAETMGETIAELGVKFETTTGDLNSLGDLSSESEMRKALKIANKLAKDMDFFVRQFKADIPVFAGAYQNGINSFAQSVSLLPEFNLEEKDFSVAEAVEVLNDLDASVKTMMENTGEFKYTMEGIPNITIPFNKAKRKTIRVLDQFLDESGKFLRRNADVRELMFEVLEGSQDHNPSLSQSVDEKLYKKFLMDLPSEGSVRFVKEHNFDGSAFWSDRLKQLFDFERYWGNVEHEFEERKLEEARKDLLHTITEFCNAIGTHTFPTHVEGMLSVPKDWEHVDPERFEDAVESIHSSADHLVKAHENLIRVGRQVLGVSPPEISSS